LSRKVFDWLADIFHQEEVEANFTLLGDGNMYWATRLAELGTRTIHARHEHSAVSMAMSYARATGKVGVASVTCGPGLTHAVTALATAAQAGIGIVVFAGESPLHASWYVQRIDQGPVAAAAGARYVPVHSIVRLPELVRDAFLYARRESMPVVIGVPMDLQQEEAPAAIRYRPSREFLADTVPAPAAPSALAAATAMIASAGNIVLIAGRGAVQAEAGPACSALAELLDAPLSTTLPARGLFHDSPFDLGVAGGFSSDVAREVFGAADLVIAIGASMTSHTADAGKLFPKARVIQIDRDPQPVVHGRGTADLHLVGDARVVVEALLGALPPARLRRQRSDALATALRERPADAADYTIEADLLDPRRLIERLDTLLPKNWNIVNGAGHSAYFPAHMRQRPAECFHTIREFGAIGNGIAYGIGVAIARPETPTVIIDGDGGFLMHVQELDTVQRHGLKLLVCVLNDGGFGAEFHKLRAKGMDESGAIFGRGDLGALARGFQLDGERINGLDQLEPAMARFMSHAGSAVWDLHISDRVISPNMRARLA
jgi:acetolactate synthase-1/2/3 large subunit